MTVIKYKIKNNLGLKSKRKIVYILTLVLISGSVYFFIYNRDKCAECVYRNGDIKVTKSELDKALKTRLTFYSFNKQTINEEQLRSEALNELKMNKEIYAKAEKNNISVTQTDVDALYQERIKQNESEVKLLEKVNNLYGYSKEDYLKVLELDILREKLSK